MSRCSAKTNLGKRCLKNSEVESRGSGSSVFCVWHKNTANENPNHKSVKETLCLANKKNGERCNRKSELSIHKIGSHLYCKQHRKLIKSSHEKISQVSHRKLKISEICIQNGFPKELSLLISGFDSVFIGELDSSIPLIDKSNIFQPLLSLNDGNEIITGKEILYRYNIRDKTSIPFSEHKSEVTYLYLFSDQYVISGTENGTIYVWDFSGTNKYILIGHKTKIKYISQILSTKYIGTCDNNEIRGWNLENGICEFLIKNPYIGNFIVLSNMYLISGSYENINVWDLKYNGEETLNPKLEVSGHTGYVTKFEILSRDEFISGSRDKSLRIWKLKDINISSKYVLNGHTSEITKILVISRESCITGDYSGMLRIWDLKEEPICLHIIHGYTKRVHEISIIPNDNRILTWATFSNKITVRNNLRVLNPILGTWDEILENNNTLHNISLTTKGQLICLLPTQFKIWN